VSLVFPGNVMLHIWQLTAFPIVVVSFKFAVSPSSVLLVCLSVCEICWYMNCSPY
jgi:hypothetical protein